MILLDMSNKEAVALNELLYKVRTSKVLRSLKAKVQNELDAYRQEEFEYIKGLRASAQSNKIPGVRLPGGMCVTE